MALEATFRRLLVALCKLDDALSALHVTVGDTPPNDESALAEALEETVLEMQGTLHEIRTSALCARKAVAHPADLDNARHALTRCQEGFHRIEQQFRSDLASYQKLKELARLGSERRVWLPWASSNKLGIKQCRESLEKTSTALALCWQELAERLGAVNISMRATNVGQHITVTKPKIEDLEVEGVT